MKDPYLITQAEAIEFAEAMVANRTGSVAARGDLSVEAHSYLDANQSPTAHLINLSDGGFDGWVMIAGDRRVMPLLAYGFEGARAIDAVDLPGLNERYGLAVTNVEEVRYGATSNITSVYDLDRMASSICLGPRGDCPSGGGGGGGGSNDCTSFDRTDGPLLTTTWGQDCPYNVALDRRGCDDNCNNGRPVAGCVAVAMAQVMRFHQWPNNFDYGRMFDAYTVGARDFQRASELDNVGPLIETCGDRVNMVYACDWAAAHPSFIDDAFRLSGYTRDGSRVNWSPSKVRADIQAGRPVIIEGRRTAVNNWHVWVADGYRHLRLSSNCGTTYGWQHMNWGWDGRGNGWYATDVWQPRDARGRPIGENFAEHNKIVTGIRP